MKRGLPSREELMVRLAYNQKDGQFLWAKSQRDGWAGKPAGWMTGGRIKIDVDGCHLYAHRLAWLFVYGEWPVGEIDHINGNPTDNRICNLRLATRKQNASNRKIRKDNRAGLKGVRKRSNGKYCARIFCDGKSIYLGQFLTSEEASAVYQDAAKRFFGEFAREL